VTAPLRLLPNVGAEEGSARGDRRAEPWLTTVASLWRRLFAADARWLEGVGIPEMAGTAKQERASFAWLETDGALTAWLNTESAAGSAEAAGLRLTGAPPAVVRRVHDKAFAFEAAREEGLLPTELIETIAVFEPDQLRDADAGAAAIERVLLGWPSWAREHFTLKPRFGSSGRGRAAGRGGRTDEPALRRALPRLAEQGGAMLEPWLDRSEDLSASLWLDENAGLQLLGTSEQVLAPSGLYRGQRGTIDSKGRVTSASENDEALRGAAVAIAGRAAREGYHGPCGLDAFTYRAASGTSTFRPVVEWNARFTLGLIAIALVKRERAAVRSAFAPSPEQRLAFYFALDSPPRGWPASDPSLRVLRYAEPDAAIQPGLAIAFDRSTLDARLGLDSS
jgi:hypothetical protein